MRNAYQSFRAESEAELNVRHEYIGPLCFEVRILQCFQIFERIAEC